MRDWANDSHIRREDAQVAAYDPGRASLARTLELAEDDVRRDLIGRGYDDKALENLHDARVAAAVTLTLSASADVGAEYAIGDMIYTEAEGDALGAPAFRLSTGGTIAAGGSVDVVAAAVYTGQPSNVPAGSLTVYPGRHEGLASIAQPSAAAGGVDHQLVRPVVLRALELMHSDLMRMADDAHDHKRRVYAKRYAEELRRVHAAGLSIDFDADGVAEEAPTLERGPNRLRRS